MPSSVLPNPKVCVRRSQEWHPTSQGRKVQIPSLGMQGCIFFKFNAKRSNEHLLLSQFACHSYFMYLNRIAVYGWTQKKFSITHPNNACALTKHITNHKEEKLTSPAASFTNRCINSAGKKDNAGDMTHGMGNLCISG